MEFPQDTKTLRLSDSRSPFHFGTDLSEGAFNRTCRGTEISLGFIWKTVEREIFEKILNLCWRFPFTGFCLPLLGFSSSFRFICEGDYVSSFGSSAEDT